MKGATSDYGMCLAQRFTEEKTNEIPAAQELERTPPRYGRYKRFVT